MTARRPSGFHGGLAVGLGMLLSAACGGVETEPDRVQTAETIVIGMPPAFGDLERPAVEFRHDLHTSALQAEGCATCHPRDERGRPSARFARLDDGKDRDELMNLYHAQCTGCHSARAARGEMSGPTSCGECHVQRSPGKPGRREMRWTYAIHDAHVQAEKGRCEGCHHVEEKGAEESCRSCHTEEGSGEVLAFGEAAHASCIPCHLERGQRSGPTTCAGCHSGTRAGAGKATAAARLARGQPDRTVIRTAGGEAVGVPFDHQGHEPRAEFCATCHHRSLAACDGCHTPAGAPKGGGVTLEAAYHHASSERSCVGCHAALARERSCAGCHAALGDGPSESSCGRCHREEAPPADPPSSELAALPALPATSAAFPETVTIGTLAREYAPSILPHRKIAAHLDSAVRRSGLARHFHGTVETLCAGCHHHSPPQARPPACANCHARDADPDKDKPGLKAAYHRQCMECHQQMGIAKLGCTDCHAREDRR